MYSDDLRLSLDGSTFVKMKSDFDNVLQRTIDNMKEKGTDEATITAKVGIRIVLSSVPTYGGEMRRVKIPHFKHEIKSVMQVKDEEKGAFGDGYELVYDEATKNYVLRKLADGQMRFDKDMNIIDPASASADVPDDFDAYEYEEPDGPEEPEEE